MKDGKPRYVTAQGKRKIISIVPSLDTPVCAVSTRKFHEQARAIDNTVVLVVSADLPFAQKRWSDAARMNRVQTLSDHRDASFGTSYGLLIKELRLLARAVLLVDREGTIRYVQVVREMTDEPAYDEVFTALDKLT